MKAELLNIDTNPILTTKFDNRKGIHSFGAYNSYPIIVKNAIAKSPTAKGLRDLAARYITGEPTEYKSLIRSISKDIATFNGYAIWIGYNGKLEVTDIKHIPFDWCRLGQEDDNRYVNKILVKEDWNNRKDAIPYYAYTSNKEALKAQMLKSDFNGQVFYKSFDSDSYIYPLSPFDSVLMDCITDIEISQFRYNTIRKGFLNLTIIKHAPFIDEDERDSFVENIKTFQGSENASSIMLMEDPTIGDKEAKSSIEIESININLNDKLFESWIETTQSNIKRVFNAPNILLDSNSKGITNISGNTIKEAIQFFNYQFDDIREIIQDDLTLITGIPVVINKKGYGLTD